MQKKIAKFVETEFAKSSINKVIDVFYKTNPMINWGNKTMRKACEDMIKVFGLDETLYMAERIVMSQGRKYAPVATDPLQMKNKLAQFKIYFERNNINEFNGPLE
jgi:hypothetical protein